MARFSNLFVWSFVLVMWPIKQNKKKECLPDPNHIASSSVEFSISVFIYSINRIMWNEGSFSKKLCHFNFWYKPRVEMKWMTPSDSSGISVWSSNNWAPTYRIDSKNKTRIEKRNRARKGCHFMIETKALILYIYHGCFIVLSYFRSREGVKKNKGVMTEKTSRQTHSTKNSFLPVVIINTTINILLLLYEAFTLHFQLYIQLMNWFKDKRMSSIFIIWLCLMFHPSFNWFVKISLVE
jgi:hypothetical protein